MPVSSKGRTRVFEAQNRGSSPRTGASNSKTRGERASERTCLTNRTMWSSILQSRTNARVAQWQEAAVLEAVQCGFDSLHVHQENTESCRRGVTSGSRAALRALWCKNRAGSSPAVDTNTGLALWENTISTRSIRRVRFPCPVPQKTRQRSPTGRRRHPQNVYSVDSNSTVGTTTLTARLGCG